MNRVIQYNTMQFNSMQCNAMQFISFHFISIQFNSIQFNSIQFNSIQFGRIIRSYKRRGQYQSLEMHTADTAHIPGNMIQIFSGSPKILKTKKKGRLICHQYGAGRNDEQPHTEKYCIMGRIVIYF
jgi:hypothetical protein